MELESSFSLQARLVKPIYSVFHITIVRPQYSILMASLMNSKSKYILSAIEFHRAASRGGENAPPWEDKSMWIFYVDLITGACPRPIRSDPF